MKVLCVTLVLMALVCSVQSRNLRHKDYERELQDYRRDFARALSMVEQDAFLPKPRPGRREQDSSNYEFPPGFHRPGKKRSFKEEK
ncbi:predicted protein [Nematostella vectensis]|uniref:RPamide n=1 Tax=Nematostella vectensis TaxID=45351 RepID=A7SFP8_NEMVE|nr:uncharacterized protein LOC125561168 [Nematostella vectensis]XP_048580631.1 uncharacterized protein LOC125561168 [Nematostella vectensis]XP_048580632.1 uncharacterized protein LOC125561168 [Nematostella vectensis]EDO37503.1 predicted protein [Nematostella vectensis]QIN55517.1 RPamide precursor [Nematostella vectensis]|eukprot:XP_001629566.1 predicted protein [Nematostella vectensis]